MSMKSIATLAIGSSIAAIVVIGVLNFDLMVEIWVKMVIAVLFVRVIINAVRRVTRCSERSEPLKVQVMVDSKHLGLGELSKPKAWQTEVEELSKPKGSGLLRTH